MDAEEKAIFYRTKRSFDRYFEDATKTVILPTMSAIDHLKGTNKVFAESRLVPQLELLTEAIRVNSELCDLVSSTSGMNIEDLDDSYDREPTVLDEAKVTSVLRQIAREWSSDGKQERLVAYGRITYALVKLFPNADQRSRVKVMVPGCGLGRLPFELSLLGFNAVGNEYSSHMLLASQAILNSGVQQGLLTLYPYIHSRSHWRTQNDMLRPVQIPDISLDMPQPGEMAMGIGDFFDMAFDREIAHSFQAVATCFFIDAPFDFFKTLDAITNATEPGGYWINFGPLHWHSEMSVVASNGPTGVELSLEDVLSAVENKGWEVLDRESAIQTTYCSTHPNRMGRMIFECEFWVARKVLS